MSNNHIKNHILVCGGTGCRASQGEDIIESLRQAVQHNGLEQEIQVVKTGCFGFCEKGPIVKIIPDNTFYVHVKPDDAEEIVAEHLVKGRTVTRLLYTDPETKQTVPDSKHMGFYRKQLRIALRNCGFINSNTCKNQCSTNSGCSYFPGCINSGNQWVVAFVCNFGFG